MEISILKDPLLEKAKLLISAAQSVNNNLLQTTFLNREIKISNDINNISNDNSPSKEPSKSGRFRASTINGSVLVNIQDDVRQFINKGDTIYIDGNLCK